MTAPIEPVRGPRVEPAAPARRVERSTRDPQRERGRQGWKQAHDEREPESDDDDGLHVDVRA